MGKWQGNRHSWWNGLIRDPLKFKISDYILSISHPHPLYSATANMGLLNSNNSSILHIIMTELVNIADY
jgi:hypothetical protein